MTEFDRHCLSQGINLVRYGDDFVVVAGDWLQVNRALEQITQWLADIYLTLQPDWTLDKISIFAYYLRK
ncbi:MAG: hypothetical protein RH949_24330 [Coleofasciculus sp. A1-SPW-01]|uniref:hypothetical protein n=1 Tax=Coleofasciculus sp. A1-SPW-01 TaxID=3070819 RepID=UPI0032F896DC